MARIGGITLHQVAEAAGVSPATASRALCGGGKVSAELRERVLRCARELGYVQRAGSRSRIIAVVLQAASNCVWNPYARQLLDRILLEESERRGYRIMLVIPRDVDILPEYAVEGILSIDHITSMARWFPSVKNIPMVCINDYPNHFENVYTVSNDDEQGIRLAMNHLLQYNHRKIGLITNAHTGSLNCRARITAYESEMIAAGLEKERMVAVVGEERPLHEGVAWLIRSGCTALLRSGEGEDLSLYHEIALLDRRIPEEVSVIAWETPGVSGSLTPRLTALAPDTRRIAGLAFDMLEKLITGNYSELADYKVPYRLIERESVRRL